MIFQNFWDLSCWDIFNDNKLNDISKSILAREPFDGMGTVPRLPGQVWVRNMAMPQVSRITPNGALIFRPQDTFFSRAITAPKANIHPTLPDPTVNISIIRAQQQPMQNKPWCMPRSSEFLRCCRLRQYRITKVNGVRHLSMHRYLRRVN